MTHKRRHKWPMSLSVHHLLFASVVGNGKNCIPCSAGETRQACCLSEGGGGGGSGGGGSGGGVRSK